MPPKPKARGQVCAPDRSLLIDSSTYDLLIFKTVADPHLLEKGATATGSVSANDASLSL